MGDLRPARGRSRACGRGGGTCHRAGFLAARSPQRQHHPPRPHKCRTETFCRLHGPHAEVARALTDTEQFLQRHNKEKKRKKNVRSASFVSYALIFLTTSTASQGSLRTSSSSEWNAHVQRVLGCSVLVVPQERHFCDDTFHLFFFRLALHMQK